MKIGHEKVNIFDGLHSENHISQILINLIKKYPTFAKKFQEFFDITDIAHIDREVELSLDESGKNNIKKFGRIDICIKDAGKCKILIENKIYRYTSLTENQPEGYIHYSKDSNSNLYFLVPKYYYHISVLKDKENELTIKYWEDFIDTLKKDEFYLVNPFFEEFVGIMESVLNIINVHFSEMDTKYLISESEVTMSSNTIPKLLKKLIKIVDGVGRVKYGKKKNNDPSSFYGYDINIDGNLTIWYGIEYDVWEDKGYPLILWAEDYNDEQKLTLVKDYDFEEYGDDVLIFSFNNDLSEENLSEKILDKIEKILKKLSSKNKVIL